jgi:hypothetical protein
MARNGSGTFSLPQPAFTPGSTIASSAVNSDFSDIAAALTQSISKDGQTVYTGNQPMGGNKFTGLGAGSAAADSVNVGQIVAGGLTYAAGSGTDTIAIAPTPGITAYAVGQTFSFKAAATNTGAVTLNVSTVGAGPVRWPDGTALAAGDIVTGGIAEVEVADITSPTAPVFHLLNSSKPTFFRTGGTISGATTIAATLTMSGAAINEAVRVDVASATTCDIGAAASNYVRITGTTTITGLGTIASGARRKVVFGGILTLTHNATSLILPTGANITTAAGDCVEFESEGSGNWRCTDYMRASGQPVAANPVYVTMKAIGAFPFSFSYTPLRSTSILTIEVDIPSIGGTGVTNSLTVTVGASTLNTAFMQFTNLAYHASSFRVIGAYQVVSGAALTIGSDLTGGGALGSGTVYMRVTESDGVIS